MPTSSDPRSPHSDTIGRAAQRADATPACAPVPPLSFEHLARNAAQVVIAPPAARVVDENGNVYSAPVRLPSWTKCVYYAPFQRHAINPSLDLWPEGYNQCHPLPVDSLATVKRGGIFVVLKLSAGDYMAVLPLVGHQSCAWLRGDGRDLRLDAGTFGTSATYNEELPLVAVVRDDNLYRACARAWENALGHPSMKGVGRLRHAKTYPEVFEHLGWCSFEEFKLDINETIITEAIRQVAASDLPIRWVLVDDGHIDDGSRAGAAALQTQEGAAGQGSDDLQSRRLRSPMPHPEKFPGGWSPIVQAAAGSRIKWLGLWLNFNGYWGGISSHHDMGSEVDAHLVEVGPGAKLPGERRIDGELFFDRLTRPAHDAGFSFLKVDNQAGNLRKYQGRVPNAVRASASCRQGLDAAVDRYFDGIIGCMAHNNLCAFHQPTSQVMRCSEDYKKEDEWRARHHLHNSFGNMLWLGQTVWGDHDMFHSSDRIAGALMARTKAISGGPVYLSDAPARFVPELIRPLCRKDGRILRPLAPAVPLNESVFIDPYEDDEAYRVIAPLAHGCAAAAAYNLTYPAKPVRGAWTSDDHHHASALLSEEERRDWRRQAEAILRFDCLANTAELQTGDVGFSLAPLTDAFVIFSPVCHGWALIGDPSKYLPPMAITRFDITETEVVISAEDACSAFIWRSKGDLVATAPLRHLAGGLWSIDLAAGNIPAAIRLVAGGACPPTGAPPEAR